MESTIIDDYEVLDSWEFGSVQESAVVVHRTQQWESRYF